LTERIAENSNLPLSW